MLIKEVTKQLPSDLSKNTIEKRIERARKIYDLFSTIGFEKIQRVKTPVSHIYGLSWEDIDTLGEKFRWATVPQSRDFLTGRQRI